MTKSNGRQCDLDDLKAALFFGHVTESDFMRRATHDHDMDFYEAIAFVVEARARECGNG